MGAFLASLGAKDLFYGGIVVALLSAFGWYTLHERDVQAAKDAAADAKVVAAQVVHDQEVEARAQSLIIPSAKSFEATVTAPPAASAPSVVCDVAPRSSPVRKNASPGPVNNGPPAGSTVVGEQRVDIGPLVDHELEVSDARVKALQTYIQTCQDEGFCAK